MKHWVILCFDFVLASFRSLKGFTILSVDLSLWNEVLASYGIDHFGFYASVLEVNKKMVSFVHTLHCNPIQVQYRTGTGFSLYTFSHKEKPVFITVEPCSHCRDPAFITGTLFSLQDFPVRKSTQWKPCSHYREWVCSVSEWNLLQWSMQKEQKSIYYYSQEVSWVQYRIWK